MILKSVKGFFSENYIFFKEQTALNKLLFITVFSLFLPGFVVILPVLVYSMYALFKKDFLFKALDQPLSKILLLFIPILVIVPVFYKNWVGLLGGTFAALVLIMTIQLKNDMTAKIYDKICEWCAFLSVPCFIAAIAEYIFLADPKVERYRVVSSFYNTNYYAFVIEIVILISLYKILTDKKSRPFYAVTGAVNIFAAFMTLNRSIWPALAVGVIVILLLLKKYKIVIISLSLIAVAGLIIVFHPEFIPRFKAFELNKNLRFNIWETAYKGLFKHPYFGRGIWSYILLYKEIGGPKQYTAHTIILDPILNFGFIGTALLLAYFTGYLRFVLQNLKQYLSNKEGVLCFTIMITTFVHCLADLPIVGIEPLALFFIITVIPKYETAPKFSYAKYQKLKN